MDSKERDELLRKLETDIWDVKGGIMQVLQLLNNQRSQEKTMLSEADRKILLDLQGQVLALQFMLAVAIADIAKTTNNGAELIRGIVSTFETFGMLKFSSIGSGPEATVVLESAKRCIEGVGNTLLADDQSIGDRLGSD